MDSTTAFFAFCLLVLSHCALLTSSNSISIPESSLSLSETNNADANADTSFLIRILNSASESSVSVQAEVSHKRSTSNDNLTEPPAAFVVAEDLSGAELEELLQGVMNQDGTGITASVRCSGEVVEKTETNFPTSPVHDECNVTNIHDFNNMEPNTRGLCPWTYAENIDSNRYPSSIMYAQCACPLCQTEDGQRLNFDLGCQPIYYDVKVLRKHVCRGGIQIHESAYERVPVACACLRHPIVPASLSSTDV